MTIPTAPDPFVKRVDSLLCDAKYPNFDLQQRLRLHFLGTHVTLASGERLDLKKIDQIPVERILGWLPLLCKISILFKRMGVAAGNQALLLSAEVPASPASSLTDTECSAANAFGQEIETEIDGVVTIYELDALRILRMRLFAALDRCFQRDSGLLNLAIKKQVNQAVVDSTVRKELELVRSSLIQMFGYIRNYEHPDYLPGAERKASDVLQLVAALPETWKHKPESPEKRKLNQDIERLQKVLKTLHRALEKPYVLFPLLLDRIRSIPRISCTKPVDIEAIDLAASSWLDDAVASWEIQSQTLLPLLKNTTKLEKTRKALIDEAKQQVNPAIAKALQELHAFEQLPSDRQLDSLKELYQLKTTCESAGENFETFSDRMQQFTREVQDLIPANSDQLPDNETFPHYDKSPAVQLPIKVEEEINTPQYCYFRVTSSIIDSIEARCGIYQRFYHIIGQVLTPTYRRLSGIPLVDLLQWQMRSHYESAMAKHPKLIKDKLEQHQIPLDIVFGYTRQLLTAQHLQHSVEDYHHYKWANRASSIAITLDKDQDLKQAPEDVKPLLNHYMSLADVLSHFLLFRKAHKMLTRNPYQQEHPPQLEEKFYFALFGMIRNMFLSHQTDMLKEIVAPLLLGETAAHEKPLVDKVKDLLKAYSDLAKLQDKLRQQPSPTQ